MVKCRFNISVSVKTQLIFRVVDIEFLERLSTLPYKSMRRDSISFVHSPLICKKGLIKSLILSIRIRGLWSQRGTFYFSYDKRCTDFSYFTEL